MALRAAKRQTSGKNLSAAALEEIRRHTRTNTSLTAAIEFAGDTMDVFVRNLSVAGAMVEGRNLPEQGQSVILRRNDQTIPGTVMWRAEGRCGVSFAHLVNVDELARTKGGI